MKVFYTYLMLELKKGFSLFRKTIGSMCGLLLILGIGIFLISHFIFQSTSFETVHVGLTISKEDDATRLVSRVVSSMDSVSSICKFYYMEKEEALRNLENGDLQVVIDLPDNFYQDVDFGINTPATVYFPYNTTINEAVFGELLIDGVSIIQTSESAVYASFDVAKNKELLVEWNQIGNIISRIYINMALMRNKIFNQTVFSSMGSANIYEYYFASGITIFLLLSGLNFGLFYKSKLKAVEQKLKLYGMTEWKIGLVRICVMTLLLWIQGLILYFAGCLCSKLFETSFLRFDISVLFALIPLCIGISAFFHFVYRVAREGMQGTVLLLILIIGMVLCSGAVVPTAYIPDAVKKIGSIMPLTFWEAYCVKTFFEGIGLTQVCVALEIGTLEFLIGEVVAWKNT